MVLSHIYVSVIYVLCYIICYSRATIARCARFCRLHGAMSKVNVTELTVTSLRLMFVITTCSIHITNRCHVNGCEYKRIPYSNAGCVDTSFNMSFHYSRPLQAHRMEMYTACGLMRRCVRIKTYSLTTRYRQGIKSHPHIQRKPSQINIHNSLKYPYHKQSHYHRTPLCTILYHK